MKLLFICGSLEPGRDGVGDYTRRLSGELINQHKKVLIIAINDKYINSNKIETYQYSEQTKIPVVRIPSSWNFKDRYNLINIWINRFDPDRVSLQYVGFAYNQFGLPISLFIILNSLIKNRYFHIMFHELWCGMAINSSRKERILGAVQRIFIKILVKRLKPFCVFTSTTPYADFLNQLNIKSKIVPIFSNIPKHEKPSKKEINNLIKELKLYSLIESQQRGLVIGIFGSIYNLNGLGKMLKYTAEAATNLNLKLYFISLGYNRGQNINSFLKATPHEANWETGTLSSALINHLLKFVHLGLITTPVGGINKSGTASTWLEHGIPLIISPDDKGYDKSIMEIRGIYQIKSPRDIITALNNRNNANQVNRFKEVVDFYQKSFFID